MVRQLLSLASVDGAEVGLETSVDVATIVRDVVDDLTRLASAKDVSVSMAGRPSVPCKSDPVLLTVALRNVVENSIAVAPEGSKVRVTIEVSEDRLEICVMDRGPGIADRDRGRITDRFFLGAGSTADGSGLGLAIVETAVKRLGGRLAFAARPGGGEMVTLTLVKS
jgi:two-component system, OmpR family, sensor histidine kinase QseC